MKRLFAVRWINPDTDITGEMHNVRRHELENTIDRAWKSAGPNGQVDFGEERHDAVEYSA